MGDDTERLLELLRNGDSEAYGELFTRYRDFAFSVARRARAADPDDAVAEAFRRTLAALHRGRGPVSAFGSYLATAIRSTIVDGRRATGSEFPIGDPLLFEEIDGSMMTTNDSDPDVVAAFMSLPERWREAIWMADIEGYSRVETARFLHMSSPNSVSALLGRARSGLRAAYLTQLVGAAHTPEVARHLRMVIAGGDPVPLDSAVQRHLDDCPECADIAIVVARVHAADLRSLVAPALIVAMGFPSVERLLPTNYPALPSLPLSASLAGRVTPAPVVIGVAVIASFAAIVAAGAESRSSLDGAPTTVGATSIPSAWKKPPPMTSRSPISLPSPERPSAIPTSGVVSFDPTVPPPTASESSIPAAPTPPATVPQPASTAAPSTPPPSSQPAPTTAADPTAVPAPTAIAPAPTTAAAATTTTTAPATTTTTTTPATSTTAEPTTTTPSTTTTTTPGSVSLGEIVGIWFNEPGRIRIEMAITAMNGDAGSIRFSEPMEFQRIVNTVCTTPTRCEFANITSPAEIVIEATTSADSLLIELLDEQGNLVDTGVAE